MPSSPDTLSVLGARWSLKQVDADALSAMPGHLHPAAARCLILRGMDDAGGWFSPSLEHFHDPFAMRNMEAAVARLHQALRDDDHIRVITDYDVDGTTSSLILQATLRIAGKHPKLDYHIPDRFHEGYGFSVIAARKAAEDGVKLIVTADIGVRDHAAVAEARNAGIDVLICDHHLPAGASVPEDAIVLCPPQADCDYPNPYLAACGVTLKLAQAMLSEHNRYEDILRSLLKLSSIGTVADLVPLATLENRAIVSLGLRSLNQGPHHAGLQALIEASDLKSGIDETSLGFRIGPRINAAGRIAKATHVVELLNCRDPIRAKELAKELDDLNVERRRIQNELVEHALAMVSDPPDDFVVVNGPEEEGWHRGVVGIVAARLKEELHRPVAVAATRGEFTVGSVRSIPTVHAVRALESAEDLLERFGGHPMAAGFTVRTERVDELRERLCAWVQNNTDTADLIAVREIDAALSADELDFQLHAQLARMAPFGQGNPEPELMLQGVRCTHVKPMGKTQNHLSARLAGTRQEVRLVWWRAAEHQETLDSGPVDLVGNFRQSEWRGQHRLEFFVNDARVST